MVSRGRRGLFFAFACVVLMGASTPAQADAGAAIAANFASNVPDSVRVAVNDAMSIWSARLDSSVPIEVDVEWGGLPHGVAAASEPLGFFQPEGKGGLFPSALANALDGYDHDPSAADMRLRLGSAISWYTGLDGAVPATATDMVTIVLHELAHGFGFYGSFAQTGSGELGWGREFGNGVTLPISMDMGLTDVATGQRLLTMANPSAEMMHAATSNRVVWSLGARDSRGQQPVIYAPSAYEPHSSLLHLDDAAYPKGDPDSLMTSLIKRGESIHRIGPATLGILADLGWTVHAEPPEAPARAARANAPVAPSTSSTSSTSTTDVAVDAPISSQAVAVRVAAAHPARAHAKDEAPVAGIGIGLLGLAVIAGKKLLG